MPAALSLGTWLFVRSRTDGLFRFGSTFADGVIAVRADDIAYRPEQDFANYPLGVIDMFAREDIHLPGADFFFHGNLPIGAGLSSSASVEVATATAICALTDTAWSGEQIAILAQRAENQFVGVNSGIMDQFAVAMGKRDSALSLHCSTLAYEVVPMHADGCRLVIANTNVQRTLAGSKYNERRSECDKALAILRDTWPDLDALADVTPEMWPDAQARLRAAADKLDDTAADILIRRARHVVFENARAKEAPTLLANGQLEAFGESMNASHQSLRDDYEVTGDALDALAEAAWAAPGCIGSRMTGAGFGGCTVSLVRENAIDEFVASVAAAYEARLGIAPSFYITEIGDGAREIALDLQP